MTLHSDNWHLQQPAMEVDDVSVRVCTLSRASAARYEATAAIRFSTERTLYRADKHWVGVRERDHETAGPGDHETTGIA